MPIFALNETIAFPPAHLAEPDGLLAVGGDLRPQRLLLAYALGIFPWFAEGQPILWHSPDPRFVLLPERLHIGRSLRRSITRRAFEIRFDTAFREVIEGCQQTPRPGQPGTWITAAMVEAYVRLHELGFAHSVEAYAGGELAGGVYGVSLGGAFFGESMFTRRADASKVAFVELVRALAAAGIDLVDCQVPTDHLARFGAEDWPRARFLAALAKRLERPTLRGPWTDMTGPAT